MSNQNKTKQDDIRGVLSRMVTRNREIPVFIHPTELNFYIGDKSTHRQLLTVYNPYDFPIKYQLLTNATERFTIDYLSNSGAAANGIIAAHSYIELSVHHLEPVQKNILLRDKILVTLHDATTNQVIGKRVIYALVLPKNTDPKTEEENTRVYTPCPPSRSRREAADRLEEYTVSCRLHIILFCIMLITLLLLPTHYEENETKDSALPQFLHVSLGYKIIAAYILGMITMAVMRTDHVSIN